MLACNCHWTRKEQRAESAYKWVFVKVYLGIRDSEGENVTESWGAQTIDLYGGQRIVRIVILQCMS